MALRMGIKNLLKKPSTKNFPGQRRKMSMVDSKKEKIEE